MDYDFLRLHGKTLLTASLIALIVPTGLAIPLLAISYATPCPGDVLTIGRPTPQPQ